MSHNNYVDTNQNRRFNDSIKNKKGVKCLMVNYI